MKASFTKIYSGKWLPLSWTLLTIILLCLPGSAIPGAGIFTWTSLDKIAHFILFGGIVLLWGLYVIKTYPPASYIKLTLRAALFSVALGIVLEYIQLYFIPGRSFDVLDITADALGATTIFLLYVIVHSRDRRKNKRGL